MSESIASAKSIRRRLLLFLLPPLTLLMLVGVFINYRTATIFVRAAYDQKLADIARALETQIQHSSDPAHPEPESLNAPAGILFSVTGGNGKLVAGVPRLPAAPVGSTPLTYGDASYEGRDLRLVTCRAPTTPGAVTVITVAEYDDSRSNPGRFILASTWLVDFIQVDITLLIVWIGVHLGLKPLLTVRRQIEARSARELRPLDAASVPTEVRPLVDALNLLFEMLSGAARAQSQFVADTAHQLRTPIAGLLGSLQVLMREPAAAPLQSRLASLYDGLSTLSHSANQLLALAQADRSTSLADVFRKTDLKAVVERAVERNVDRAVECGLDLGAECSPATVEANARLLDDLLGNLMDNALKYTPSGGRVTVRCGYETGRPFLEVEDDGPGIPEVERPRVLERFYRIPGSAAGGCGLGLAIVDEIARQHDARLSIESGAEGRGTRIRVLFPGS
ncbi:MAG TPA: sensor histidine kinase [Steroidobacteraceae bacterium]|nr:sensor histidine kinase [Steroidobacteraceae bacterium]